MLGLNSTVIETTTQGFSPVWYPFVANTTLAQLPYTFDANDDTYISLALNYSNITNTETGEVTPIPHGGVIPDYIDGGLPIQILINENLVTGALWANFQPGVVDKLFSQPDLLPNSPIMLNTTNLTVLIPKIAKDFGSGKGVYIRVQSAGGYPQELVKGGLSLIFPFQVDFIVDQDDDEYPQKNLTTCTACELAVSLNISAFVSMEVHRIDASTTGVEIIDMKVIQTTVLSGDVDVTSFDEALTNMIPDIIAVINTQAQSGIQNPYTGLFGLNDTDVSVGPNYLSVGFNFMAF